MGEHVIGSTASPLHALAAEGVSPWLDGFSRSQLTPERCPAPMAAGLRGAASDPDVLAADVAADDGCREQLRHLARRSVDPDTAVLALCAYDLRSACDALRPVFDACRGLEGYASMDLDARLVHDPGATVAAAEELHRAACRRNALVKIPATAAGLEAARTCLSRGIGVHLTEIFSVRRYGEALDACFDGLEQARAAGLDLCRTPVCTSFAIGRLEDAVDARLAALATAEADALRGAVAQAVARLAYRCYEERLGSVRWRTLAGAGARPPRLLWHVGGPGAGTARVLRRVESLVAWGTGVAVSAAGLEAATRECRLTGDTLTDEHGPARTAVARVERLGISLDRTADEQEARRLAELAAAWEALRTSVTEQLRAPGGPAPSRNDPGTPS
ncbi:transaldolase family protein [Streptomyces sp. I05A-00742]|uniref:transaldolase family protein n=1 Tax=Streptomyces sp. I05A-00742 TaxID=2732853 RepID=UPI0014887E75|nr:transaldolase family protein [Streptomyces sp. I05A-00742]